MTNFNIRTYPDKFDLDDGEYVTWIEKDGIRISVKKSYIIKLNKESVEIIKEADGLMDKEKEIVEKATSEVGLRKRGKSKK